MSYKPNLKRRRRVNFNCSNCGNIIEIIYYRKSKYNFCKKECHIEWRKNWTREKKKELMLNNKKYAFTMKNMSKTQWLNRTEKERKIFAEKVREGVIRFYKNNPKPIKLCSRFGCKNKHKAKGFCLKHYMDIWNKNNPDSSCGENWELRLKMNNVRKRDNNTCKWFNCNLTHKETIIDVHHIFPRSEYPELELIEKFMICYCIDHHSLWHEMRGDKYFHLIKNRLNTANVARKLNKPCKLIITRR